MNNENAPVGRCGPRRGVAAIVLLLVGILVAAEVARAWVAWQGEIGLLGRPGIITKGSWCAVTLANGQVYYGTMTQAGGGYLRLKHVYYVQSVAQPNGGPSQFRLVNRQKNDWHAPDWMLIPTDKVLYIENVGAQSRLAGLIAQDQGAAKTH